MPVTLETMSRTTIDTVAIPRQRAGALTSAPILRGRSLVDLAYVAVVLLGAVLFVIAALQQPYNADEMRQIGPYGSGDLGEVTGATRQPPLAPLLEAGIQRLLGEGQLQQRLLPVLSGIGGLVAMALLLRRLGLRYAGPLALLLMATSPLTVRYSAYTRPYAEALCLMLVLALATHAWLDTGRRRWLAIGAAAAVLMPLVRVPEPTAFMAMTVLVLAALGLRRKVPWSRVLPMMVVVSLALVAVGLVQTFVLASKADHLADVSPDGMLARLEPGLRELLTGFLPTLAKAFPLWPVVLGVFLAAVLVPGARRRLFAWPAFWPLLAAPVAFAIAYHLAFRISFDALPYRSRFASFFVPVVVLAAAALLSTLEQQGVRRPVRQLAGGLVAAMFLCQLPATIVVLTEDASPDFAEMARVLHEKVPPDAVVLYDRPTPPGSSRQPYLGQARYLGDVPTVIDVRDLPHRPIPDGPVFLLFNGQCAYEGRCVPGKQHRVDEPIAGFELVYAHDRFTLYAPTGGQTVDQALAASQQALGPALGYVQGHVRADLMEQQGQDPTQVLDRIGLSPEQEERAQYTLRLYELGPHAPDQALP